MPSAAARLFLSRLEATPLAEFMLRRVRHGVPSGLHRHRRPGRHVAYRDSGVMNLVVSHDDKVFETHLRKTNGKIASWMTTFDPGPGWTVVTP
jgi:hypothetical protein